MSAAQTPQTLHEPRLVVLAGPTAVGKGTVSAYIRTHFPQVYLSVSMTTRPPRPGEVDGVHYHFVAPQEFDRLIAAGEFLEYAVVHGRAKYGTPRGPVERALALGQPALLEIDLQGARQVRETMPEALFVFLKPPRSGCRRRAATWRLPTSSTGSSSTTMFAGPVRNSYH